MNGSNAEPAQTAPSPVRVLVESFAAADAAAGGGKSSARYGGVLRRVTTDLAEQDNVVLVGLGAGQLLRGLRQVLPCRWWPPRSYTRLERHHVRSLERAHELPTEDMPIAEYLVGSLNDKGCPPQR